MEANRQRAVGFATMVRPSDSRSNPAEPELAIQKRRPPDGTSQLAEEISHVISREQAQLSAPEGRQPIAWTQHGRSHFRPEVRTHPSAARIVAHEAVHVFQQRNAQRTGSRVNNSAALEAEADRGATALISGGTVSPQLAAPPQLALCYDSPWLPKPEEAATSEQAALTAGGFDPARSKIKVVTSSSTSLAGEAEARYRIEVDGSGANGTVVSTTEIVLRHDPNAQVTVPVGPQIRQLGPELGLYPAVNRPAYPITISYIRHVIYSDTEGRNAELDVDGTMYFSEERWREASAAALFTSFEQLLALPADAGKMRSTLSGSGPVTGYFWFAVASSTGESLGAQIAATATDLATSGRSAGMGVRPNASFLSPTLTAAEQHAAIGRMLALEDAAVLTGRLHDQSGADASSWLDQALATLAEWLALGRTGGWNTSLCGGAPAVSTPTRRRDRPAGAPRRISCGANRDSRRFPAAAAAWNWTRLAQSSVAAELT